MMAERIEWENGFTTLPEPRFMMATTALHTLGDISRDDADLCVVQAENDEYWMGQWRTGFGFINVKFPKATTRNLTDAEAAYYRERRLVMSGVDLGPALPSRR